MHGACHLCFETRASSTIANISILVRFCAGSSTLGGVNLQDQLAENGKAQVSYNDAILLDYIHVT